jgi:hypothetical protein
MKAATYCPHCAATLRAGVRRCWLCGTQVPQAPSVPGTDADEPDQFGKPANTPPISNPRTYTLSSLMLLVTWVGVCLGIGACAPWIGFGLAIAAIPAMFRTAALARYHEAHFFKSPLSMCEQAMMFLESLYLVVVIGILSAAVSLAAFLIGTVCTILVGFLFSPRLNEDLIFGPGVIAGLVVFMIIFSKVWSAFWPRLDLSGRHPENGQHLDRSP